MSYNNSSDKDTEESHSMALYMAVQGTMGVIVPRNFTLPGNPPLKPTFIPFTLEIVPNTSTAEIMVPPQLLAKHAASLKAVPPRDLSEYNPTFDMATAPEPPPHTGFTPLIGREARFESFKSSRKPTIYFDKQGTFSIPKINADTTTSTSPDHQASGLFLIASADVVLGKTQYGSLNGGIKPMVEKHFNSDALEESHKKVTFNTVDLKQEKVLRSTIKSATTYDLGLQELHSPPADYQIAKKKYKSRKSLPKTFHPFLRLPTELRHKIFKLLVPTDRIVQFTVKGDKRDEFKPTKTPVPPVLQICKESRYLTLKSLKPLFHTVACADCYNYIDPSTDILKLTLEHAQGLALTRDYGAYIDRGLVEHLQIPCRIDASDRFMADAIATLVLRAPNRSWPALKTIHLSGREKKGKKQMIRLEVKKFVGLDENKGIPKLGKKIEKALKEIVEKHGAKAEIAIMVQYQ